MQVEEFIVGGRGIDLEIAGMNDHSERRRDGQRDGAHNRVSNMNELDLERSKRDTIAGLNGVQIRLVQKFVLFQTPLDQREREIGTVHRNLELGKQERHRPDVILMAMRENQAANHIGVLLKVGEVGSNDIDAEQFRFRKHHAGVDHDDVLAIAKRHRIHPEFAKPADWYYLQLEIRHKQKKLKGIMRDNRTRPKAVPKVQNKAAHA